LPPQIGRAIHINLFDLKRNAAPNAMDDRAHRIA
jgi:hypothetical protein